MNRYTQGFIKFGPMEQCNDGKWIEYAEHEKVIESIEGKIKNLEKMSISADEHNRKLLKIIDDSIDKIFKLENTILSLAIVTVVELIVICTLSYFLLK